MNDFTDGVRDDTSLIIGIAGASGSGKTVTALLIADGLAGEDGDVAFIDTEGGRARHYFPTPNDKRSKAELRQEFLFRVKYLDMKPPFNPRSIWGAIEKAISIGAKVVVVDSTSDEWEGVGGLHDMHIAEMARLAKKPYDSLQDWELHKYNFPAWAVPKAEHKAHLMKNLRQVRAHVIFCFRANEVTKPVEVEDQNGRKRMTVQNVGWQPICEKNMLYDLTISFMVTPDAKGVPLMQADGSFYGKLNPPYSQFFQPGRQVSIETGQRLRAWAKGDPGSTARVEMSDRQLMQPSRGESTSSTNRSAAPSQASRQDDVKGADEQVSRPSAPSHDAKLLKQYHEKLAAEIDKEGVTSAHQAFKANFTDADTIKTAGKILSAHNDRIKDVADADSTNTYVEGLIDGE